MDFIRERYWRALQSIWEKTSSNTSYWSPRCWCVRDGRRNPASDRSADSDGKVAHRRGGDLWDHLVSRNARIDRAVRLFDAIRTGTLSVPAIERFPPRDGAAAHARLEDRAFSGKIVMTSAE